MVQKQSLFQIFTLLGLVLLLSLAAGAPGRLSATEASLAKTIQWDDLLPDEVLAQLNKQESVPIDHDKEPVAPQMSPDMSAVKKELNGQFVRLAGYVVPLEGNDNKVTQFLLVPYFGACIHVPPPPPSQIVYVEYRKGISADIIYDPVWIEGTIETGMVEKDMVVSGYKMVAAYVTPYTETN